MINGFLRFLFWALWDADSEGTLQEDWKMVQGNQQVLAAFKLGHRGHASPLIFSELPVQGVGLMDVANFFHGGNELV